MLVLTRQKGQKIIVRDDIEIVVLEVRSTKVILGIGAPGGVPVYREEIWLEKQKEGSA